MRRFAASIAALMILSSNAQAQAQAPSDGCEVPAYLTASEARLPHVEAAVREGRPIEIVVMGTGSSAISGPSGNQAGQAAYPARLEAALRRRLPSLNISVVSTAKARQTASQMAKTIEKLLQDRKPVLVIWQAGTVDAMRGVDPEEFRLTLDEGIGALKAGGADVILMNMQYSPRTEFVIALGPYDDNMRVAARDREVPLFDRLSIMRQWNEDGVFDLYAASKDSDLAQRVHDCLGRALASLVIEAAQLGALETKVQ